MGGTNFEGYDISLDQAFSEMEGQQCPPTKSALSQFRRSVSFEFFRDLFETLVAGWHAERATWKGYHFTAIDGDRCFLPCTESVLKEDYRGELTKKNKETYYPVAFSTSATDMISGTPLDSTFSPKNDEITSAVELIEGSIAREKTVFVMDRLYFSDKILSLFCGKDTGYFIARCKQKGSFMEIGEFAQSGLEEDTVEIEGQMVRLVRYSHSKSKNDLIFATNLPRRISANEIGEIYGYRWEAETGNRDRTSTMKSEQFHARDINGIKQEFYTCLIIQAIARMICANETKPEKDFMKKTYKKASFKAAFTKITQSIQGLIKGCQNFFDSLVELLRKSIEVRSRNSRSYERALRRPVGKLYKHRSLVSRRA